MSVRPTKVPAIPAPTNANDLEFKRAVKSVIDVREGATGDPLDANVTVRDLSDGGFLSRTSVVSTAPGGGTIPLPPGYTPPDLTTPPAPTGLAATPTLTSIILSWDSLPGGYAANHGLTQIWRSTTSAIGDAVMIGTSLSQFYTDAPGNPGLLYYYWIRYVSKASIEGPFNSATGVSAQTGQDPGALLTALTGRITASQLFSSLGARINLIDAPTTGLVDRVADLTAAVGSGGDAAAALADAIIAKNQAQTAAATATTQAGIAVSQASSATGSASAASTSASNALASAGDAGTAATAANTSKLAAESAAGTATIRRDEAVSSASSAAGSASTASTQASLAVTSASAASGSAGEALTYRNEAATSASGATGSASTATTQAGIAVSASTAAGISAGAASGSASSASVSADAASTSAATSTTQASLATTRAGEALSYRNQAATSASDASGFAAASASDYTAVQARLNNFGGSGASVEANATATASTLTGLSGQYTVKIDLAGHVSGYGLASTLNGAAPASAFGIRADSFWVAPPSTVSSTAPTTNLYTGRVWLDTSVAPNVTRYYNAATTSWSTTPTLLPFSVQATPVTIEGRLIEPGVYMDTAFIRKASIKSAMIGDLAADKITAGFTTSVDLESGVFAGSEFYIGGVVTYEYADPAEPTKKTGIASVANPNIALRPSGADFNVNYFRIYNGTTYSAPFEVRNGVVTIKKASIGDADIDSAKIYEILQSNDFNGTYIPGGPSPDPSFSSVVLLMHCEAGAPYADSSTRARSAEVGWVGLVPSGGVAGSGSIVGSSVGGAVGSAFLVFASSEEFNLRGTFTLEFSVRWTTGQVNGYFMARDATSYMQIDGGGSLTATNWAAGIPTIQLTSGVLHKITVRGNGTHVFFYRDQTLIETHLAQLRLDATPFGIFGVPGRGDLPSPQCELDEIRWTQGVDRYGGAPPAQTAAFPGGAVPGYFSSYGAVGWAIAKNGTIVANNFYSRGAVVGGGFGFADWSWPASGGGFHVSSQGIRLGREASGQFFEVSSAGAIRAPGLTISGGSASFTGSITGASGTFSGSLSGEVVNTANIVGASVTSGYSASSGGTSASVTITVPVGSSSIIVVAYIGDAYLAFTGSGKDGYSYTAIPTGTLTVNGSAVTTQKGTLVWSTGSPATGTYAVSVSRADPSGTMNLGVLVTKR